MSWNSYIDSIIGSSKEQLVKACIVGLDGSIWTTDNHPLALRISVSEAATISKIMSSKDFVLFQSSGITVENIKYRFLRDIEGTVVMGKKKEHGSITLQSTRTAIIIGITKEGGQPGDGNMAIANIAQYMEGMGM